jgi:protein AFG1
LPKRKAGFMAKSYDPIAPIAEEISQEASLLCFDEFQVRENFHNCKMVYLNEI